MIIPKPVTAVILFISAYSPLFVILAVKNFDFIWSQGPITKWIIIFFIIAVVVVSNVILLCLLPHMDRGNMNVKVTSIKDRSFDLIGYTIPYIVLFVGVDLSKLWDIMSLVVFLLMMMIIAIRSGAVFFNPVLLMWGYHMYDVEYSFDEKNEYALVFSQKPLRRGVCYYIRNVSEILYFVKDNPKKENPKNDNEGQKSF